jgi:hypothetical protein
MMEAETGPGRLPSSRVSSCKDQSVLILNQNAAPCVTNKCHALLDSLHDFLRYRTTTLRYWSPCYLSSRPIPFYFLIRQTTLPSAQIKLVVFDSVSVFNWIVVILRIVAGQYGSPVNVPSE